MAEYSEKVIDAFATNSRRKDILAAAGIGKRKYYELRKDQEFMHKVQLRRTEILSAAVQRMEENLNENVDKLQAIIRDPPERAQIMINALQLFFSVYHSMKNDAEILDEIFELKMAQKGAERHFRSV